MAASLGIPAIPNISGLGAAFIRRGLLQEIVVRLYRIGFRRASLASAMLRLEQLHPAE